MFYLMKDAAYAVWYLLGEFLIRHLWGDIQKKIDDLETSNQVCRSREHELVRQCEDSIQQANETYKQQLKEMEDLYRGAITDLHIFYGDKLDALKPKKNRKDPSKVTKPIKPRAKKKVK